MTTEHTPTRIVFFGTDAFSVPTLVKLLAEGWNVVAVVTKPDSPTGRGRQLTAPAVKRLAVAHDIPVFQPTHLATIEDKLANLHPEIGVVVAYGKIIPGSLLNLFPLGLINIHASLLPRYRGASPIESAILNGDQETGITLMQVEAGLDSGPTYDHAKLQLSGTETREELYERLADLGADLLASDLAAIIAGREVPIPQTESEATKVGRINKTDGNIDWSKPAATLEREIRAYLGWPGSRTRLADTELIITAAHIGGGAMLTEKIPATPGLPLKTSAGELAVTTGDGMLVIDRLKPAGKRDMLARDFLAGHAL